MKQCLHLVLLVAIDEAMPAQIAQYDQEFKAYMQHVTSIASQVVNDKVSVHTHQLPSWAFCQLVHVLYVTLRT